MKRKRSERVFLLFLAVVTAFVVLAVPENEAFAQEERKGAVNADNEQFRYWEYWVMPERDMVFYPDKVMELIRLKPGDTVADIGAGSGYFTFKFARAVGPEGKVYAIDKKIPPEMMKYLNSRIADPEINPYGNVELIYNQRDDVGLPDGSIDVAFMCLDAILLVHPRDVVFSKQLKELDLQKNMMESVYKSLKPGGRLAVIDLYNDPRQEEIKPAGKTSWFMPFLLARDPQTVRKNFEEAGFRFLEEFDIYSNEEHIRNVEEFKKTRMYSLMTDRQKFFQGRMMFFFLFEKPVGDRVR